MNKKILNVLVCPRWEVYILYFIKSLESYNVGIINCMFVSSHNSYVKTLTSNVMILGGEPLREN